MILDPEDTEQAIDVDGDLCRAMHVMKPVNEGDVVILFGFDPESWGEEIRIDWVKLPARKAGI